MKTNKTNTVLLRSTGKVKTTEKRTKGPIPLLHLTTTYYHYLQLLLTPTPAPAAVPGHGCFEVQPGTDLWQQQATPY